MFLFRLYKHHVPVKSHRKSKNVFKVEQGTNNHSYSYILGKQIVVSTVTGLIYMERTKAYVVGRKSGQIKESCLKLGHTLMNGKGLEGESCPPLSLDIEAEFGLLEKTQLKQQASSTTHTASTSSVKDAKVKRLKELGLER